MQAPAPAPTVGASDGSGVAVVVGSGVAGLACAQMLTKHFERVVLLERDSEEQVWAAADAVAARGANSRPGVSQLHHLHALLAKGLATLDSVFGGRFIPALKARGANVCDSSTSFMYFHAATGLAPWLRNTHAREPTTVAICSRHLLEATARRLVLDNPRVELRYACNAAGLSYGQPARAGGRPPVTGVLLADGARLPAQLVVDCSGRGSAAPSWLKAGGYERPRVSRVSANAGYASWFVKLAPEVEARLVAEGVSSVAVVAVPPTRTFGLLLREEALPEGGTLWMAGVGGNESVHPSHSDDELLAFARQKVWHPSIGRVLEGSTPLAPASRFTGLSSVWRHYEEVACPDGFVVLADAICSFSPAYGQGMTVAAIEVAALDRLLAARAAGRGGSRAGLQAEVQRAVLPVIRAAWLLAALNDARYPSASSTEPPRSAAAALAERAALWYVDVLFNRAACDPTANEALLRCVHMLDSPIALFSPRLLLHIALQSLRALLWLDAASAGAAPAAVAAARGESPALLELLGVPDGAGSSGSCSHVQPRHTSSLSRTAVLMTGACCVSSLLAASWLLG